MLIQNLMCAGDRRILLTNSHVDTEEVFALLVDDSIDRDSGLTGLTVANDQFTLSTSDGDHTIDSFKASLYGCVHTLAGNNTRGDTFNRTEFVCINGTTVIEWLAQWINNTTEKGIANGHLDNASGGTDLVVFMNLCIVAKNRATDRFLFKVKGHTKDTCACKFYQLKIFHILQAIDTGNTVLHCNDSADASRRCFGATEACDVFLY